tara:strand:+ start:405 stop:1970 length:1566 start_codon:yes stop_codon:yes gene_type:complete
MSFSELGIAPAIVEVLEGQGITESFEVQAEAIPAMMQGKDVCCRAPTGSGKTLAFGLPLISRCKPAHPRYPTALIVTPTRELAEQICKVLKPLGKPQKLGVMAVYGGTSYAKQRQRLEQGVEIVVACPGRLIDLMEKGMLKLDDVGTVVLDEADRMADMGFIDPVCHILDNCSGKRQTILFSATLDDEVSVLIRKYQDHPFKIEVGPKEVSMESMQHFFWMVHGTGKSRLASTAVKQGGRSMIFCRTRRGVDRVGKELRATDLKVATIHGGLSQNQRDRAMERFIHGDCMALVATDVAARGIDVEGVQCVIHYDPPENGKAYKHRSGRTARAGAHGTVISLVQSPQKGDFIKIQRQAGINANFTSPEFGKLPERVEYTSSQPSGKAGHSTHRGRPGKTEEFSLQNKVDRTVERAFSFRKNKSRNKYGGKNHSGASNGGKRPGHSSGGYRKGGGRPSNGKSQNWKQGRPTNGKSQNWKQGSSSHSGGGSPDRGGGWSKNRKPQNWKRGRRSSRSHSKKNYRS